MAVPHHMPLIRDRIARSCHLSLAMAGDAGRRAVPVPDTALLEPSHAGLPLTSIRQHDLASQLQPLVEPQPSQT